jgi:hypothetical protein
MEFNKKIVSARPAQSSQRQREGLMQLPSTSAGSGRPRLERWELAKRRGRLLIIVSLAIAVAVCCFIYAAAIVTTHILLSV